MAEGGSQAPPSGGGAAPVANISADILMGQSKSSAAKFVQFKELPEPHTGNNKLYLVCVHCKCTVMAPGYGLLVNKEVSFAFYRSWFTVSPSQQRAYMLASCSPWR